MAEQIQKGRQFGSGRFLNVKEFNFNAANIPRAGKPQNQYLQQADAAMGIVEFAAEERNSGIRSKYQKTQSEVNLVWETAYQKAKAENPDSPEIWTKSADDEATKIIDSNTEKGNLLTNILFNDDAVKERLETSLIRHKANKAADVQDGRLQARLRDYALTQSNNMDKFREALGNWDNLALAGSEGIIFNSSEERIEHNLLQTRFVRDRAMQDFNAFSDSLKKDSQLTLDKRKEMERSYLQEISISIIDFYTKADPYHADSYFKAVDRLSANNRYAKILGDQYSTSLKKTLTNTREYMTKVFDDKTDAAVGKDLFRIRQNLDKIEKSQADSKITDNLSDLSKSSFDSTHEALINLSRQVSELKSRTHLNAQGRKEFVLSVEQRNQLTSEFDKVTVGVLKPMYDSIAVKAAILVGDENYADPSTLNNATLLLENYRKNDPRGFYQLLSTISQTSRNEFEALILRIKSQEKQLAGKQWREKSLHDFDNINSLAFTQIKTDLTSLIVDSKNLPKEEALIKLQTFLTTVNDEYFNRVLSENNRYFHRSDSAQKVLHAGLRKDLSKILKDSWVQVDRINLGGDVSENRDAWPAIAPLIFSDVFGQVLASNRSKHATQYKAAITRRVRGRTDILNNFLTDSNIKIGRVLPSLKKDLFELAQLNHSPPEVFDAIEINFSSTAGLFKQLGRDRDNTSALINDPDLSSSEKLGAPNVGLIASNQRLDTLIKMLDTPGIDDGVQFTFGNDVYSFPPMPVDIASALYGEGSAGANFKGLRDALIAQRDKNNRIIASMSTNIIDPADGNHAVKDLELNRLVTWRGRTSSVLEHALLDPASGHGAELARKIKAHPYLIFGISDQLYQRFSQGFISLGKVTEEEKINESKALLALGKMAFHANSLLESRRIAAPKSLKDLAHSFKLKSDQIYADDPSGTVAAMGRTLQLLQSFDAKSGESRYNNLGPTWGTPDPDNQDPRYALTQGQIDKATDEAVEYAIDVNKSIYRLETVRNFGAIEGFVKSGLDMTSRTGADDLSVGSEDQAKIIIDEGMRTNQIGCTSATLGSEQEISDTCELGINPLEGGFPTIHSDFIKQFFGDDGAFNAKAVFSKAFVTMSLLEAMHARDLPIEQVRQAITASDAENNWVRQGFLKHGGKKGSGILKTENVFYNRWVEMLNEKAQELYGEPLFRKSIFELPIEKQLEMIGGPIKDFVADVPRTWRDKPTNMGSGIWGSRDKSLLGIASGRLTGAGARASALGDPGYNSVSPYAVTQSLNGPPILINGRPMWNIAIRIPPSRKSVEGVLAAGETVPETSLTLSKFQMPSGNGKSLADGFAKFVFDHIEGILREKQEYARQLKEDTDIIKFNVHGAWYK